MWIGVEPELSPTSYEEVAAGATGQWRWLDNRREHRLQRPRPTA
jgi:hypothetical protein